MPIYKGRRRRKPFHIIYPSCLRRAAPDGWCISGFPLNVCCGLPHCSLLELDSLTAYSWYTPTITVGWGVTPCSLSGYYEYFGGTFCFHLERTLLREYVEFFRSEHFSAAPIFIVSRLECVSQSYAEQRWGFREQP
jgi:hypothetical protein